MVGLGARGTDAELEQVTEYLATNFKGEAPKPINMNTASSVELESVAALLRKEAAAWIVHQNTKGELQDTGRPEKGRRGSVQENRRAPRPTRLLLNP